MGAGTCGSSGSKQQLALRLPVRHSPCSRETMSDSACRHTAGRCPVRIPWKTWGPHPGAGSARILRRGRGGRRRSSVAISLLARAGLFFGSRPRRRGRKTQLRITVTSLGSSSLSHPPGNCLVIGRTAVQTRENIGPSSVDYPSGFARRWPRVAVRDRLCAERGRPGGLVGGVDQCPPPVLPAHFLRGVAP